MEELQDSVKKIEELTVNDKEEEGREDWCLETPDKTLNDAIEVQIIHLNQWNLNYVSTCLWSQIF